MEDNSLTLEKLEIHKRLTMLESKLEVLIELKKGEKETYGEIFHRMAEHIDKINHIVIGNGTIGMIGRLDKVETHIEESKFNGKIAKTALIGVIIKFIWDLVFHVK